MQNVSEKKSHARAQALIFKIKAALLQTRRGFENMFDGKLKKFPKAYNLNEKSIIAESKTPLWTESGEAEQFLLAGKIHNLRLAIKRLDNLEIPAGEVFSFWKHVGRANRLKGYVEGRELREGCIIPNVGGGLCQLSNALYDAALRSNFEIVERHAHTQIVPGSLAEQGRDATVFWNYVDLRFKAPAAFRIEAKLERDYLTVKLKGDSKKQNLFQITKRADAAAKSESPNSCASCGVESCFRSLKAETNLNFGRTAFLLDEFAPEFDAYIRQTRSERDVLFLPLDGKRFRKANYAWSTQGFAKIRQSLLTTLMRSYRSRKLAAQGALRQKALLEMSEKMAKSFSKNLSYETLHVVVSQNLLPFLWKDGALGGRTFDVLMNSLPVSELQKRLDYAASLHPESKTLGDFRAERWLLEAETEALKNARKIITPHTEIAALFGEKAELVNWNQPEIKNIERKTNEKFTVVFPASTVGRKGCYELREALRGLDVKIIVLGAMIEDASFWDGFDWEKGSDDWPGRADLVVLPAFVEHKPRRLLLAAAQGIPVIASHACGLKNVEGVKSVEAGDAGALGREIKKFIK